MFIGAKRRGLSKWGALFAFFALYLQFVLPVGYAIAASNSIDQDLPGKAIVCSYYGVKYIDLATGEEVVVSADEVGAKCPICISIDLGSSTLNPETGCAAPSLDVSQTLLPALTQSGHNEALPTDYSSRAPPKRG